MLYYQPLVLVPQPSFDCFFFGAAFFTGAVLGAAAGADGLRLLDVVGAAGVATGAASAGAAPADRLAAELAAELLCASGVGESAGAEEFTVGRCTGAPIGRPR